MKAQKAQIGTVYKLLISAVFAVALLAIVHNYTQSMHPPITGMDAAKEVLESASRAPGRCFSRDPVHFIEGEYYEGGMLKRFTHPEVTVTVNGQNLGNLYENNEIKQDVRSSISAECDSTACAIWLGSSTCGR